MYKKYTFNELFEIKTKFFQHLRSVLNKKRYPTLKMMLRDLQKQGNDIYYFQRSSPIFHIKFSGDDVIFFDESEKIELHADKETLGKLHGILKDTKKIQKQTKWSKRINKILRDLHKQENLFTHLDGKPYLVYDIETTAATNDLTKTKFYLAYAYVVTADGKARYKYIDESNLESFVHFMINFDGYIVGFNNIAFDNPVSVYNIPNRSQDMIDTINAKSIDLFLFFWNLTNRRLGLNKISAALVGVEKTLDSGAEGDVLMQKYKETWDESYLNEFKKYCKNDVEMTVLVLFYFLHYKKVYLDETDYTYELEDFMRLSQTLRTDKKWVGKQTSMFSWK